MQCRYSHPGRASKSREAATPCEQMESREAIMLYLGQIEAGLVCGG